MKPPPRTIAVGDVHGCDVALAALLAAIEPQCDDTLVFLGDLIDRGPDSRGVIERVIALEAICRVVALRGDHEEMLLVAIARENELPRWLRNGGSETLRSYGWRPKDDWSQIASLFPSSHVDFLRRTRDYYETQKLIFVHAGYVPDLPMASQPSLALRWRVARRETSRPHCSGKTIIAGHTAQRSGEMMDLGYLKCIDTNCVRGGALTALDAESGKIWRSDAHSRILKSPPIES